MKRMKRHITVISDDDDQEEERGRGRDKARKIIPKKKKTKDMEEDEEPGPSTQNVHSHKAHRKRSMERLDVTCGNKSGIMHVEKLQRGEDCIEYNNEWFSPSAFEELGGKGSSKKWKATIFHEDKPLQDLFEQGDLITMGYKRRSKGIPKKMQTPPSPPTSGSSSDESEAEVIESEPSDVNDDDWHPKSLKLEGAASEGVVFIELTDSEGDTSKEEVDTVIEPELDGEEDEDMAAVAKNIKTVKEWEALTKSALQKEPRVSIKRLLKVDTDSQCNHKEHLPEESKPLNERRQNEEDTEPNSSSIDYNTEDKMCVAAENMDAMSTPGKINIKYKITDTMGSGSISGTGDAQLQVMNMESMAPEMNQLPDVAHSPDTMKSPSSQLSSSCDLDTMDLDQLRREKIKKQIRVLSLQEEYFTKILNRPEKMSNL